MKSTKGYPTPETCSEPETLNNIERRIFDAIVPLRELEKLDPVRSHDERVKFLQNFKWDESLLSPSEQAQVKELLVKYDSIFTRHRYENRFQSKINTSA